MGPGRTWGGAGQNYLPLFVSVRRSHLLAYIWRWSPCLGRCHQVLPLPCSSRHPCRALPAPFPRLSGPPHLVFISVYCFVGVLFSRCLFSDGQDEGASKQVGETKVGYHQGDGLAPTLGRASMDPEHHAVVGVGWGGVGWGGGGVGWGGGWECPSLTEGRSKAHP